MTPSGYTESYNTKANTISISEGGNSCGYVAFNEQNFWSGGHNYTLSQLKIDVKFLYQNLKKKESFIMSLRVGSGLPNVQKTRLAEVIVSYPDKGIEQKKIASFLSNVDSLITLHQRNYNKINKYTICLDFSFIIKSQLKLSLLYSLNAYSWEQRKLDEISTINKGQQLNKSSLESNGTYYVLNGGMTPSGYTESYNTKANTISISEGGNSCGYVAFNEQNFWSGGHNYTLSQLKIDVKFLYQNLKKKESFIMSLRVGSGLPNVQKTRLAEVIVSYPDKGIEQKKIASFLSNVDSLITLHQRKRKIIKFVKIIINQKLRVIS